MDRFISYLTSNNVSPDLAVVLSGAIGISIGLAFVSVLVMLLVWGERRIAGFMQARLGPNRVGPAGIFQSLADGVKLFMKEDIVPAEADKFWFKFAPYLVMAGAVVPLAVLPLSNKLYIANMDAALFFFLGFATLEVLGLLMAGWGSSSKWSLYGAIRVATQMVSYELPLGLSALTIIIMTGSLSFHDIVDAQGWSPMGWNLFRSPFAFVAGVIFYTSGLAEAKRLPFDLPEAESELVAGFHTEYSGLRFSFFFLAEYAAMFILAAATAILFLGGWATPNVGFVRAIPGIGAIVLAVKWAALLFLMLWIRWTFPRIRLDQVMHMCLKVFLPLSFVCLFGAAVWQILTDVVVGPTVMYILGWLLTIPVFLHAVKVVWKGA